MSAELNVVLYSRPGCCLCDKAKVILAKVQKEIPYILKEVNISESHDLEKKYKYLIPVVAINNDDIMVSKISEYRFRKILSETLQRDVQTVVK